jgi:hypothetical protein
MYKDVSLLVNLSLVKNNSIGVWGTGEIALRILSQGVRGY